MCSLPVVTSMCSGQLFCSEWSRAGYPGHPELVSGHLLLLLSRPSRLVCSQGLVGGWPRVHTLVCIKRLPPRGSSPPCLASERWDKKCSPCWPQQGLVSDWPMFPRKHRLLAFGQLPWWRRTLDLGKCFIHPCHYLHLLMSMIKSCYWWL